MALLGYSNARMPFFSVACVIFFLGKTSFFSRLPTCVSAFFDNNACRNKSSQRAAPKDHGVNGAPVARRPAMQHRRYTAECVYGIEPVLVCDYPDYLGELPRKYKRNVGQGGRQTKHIFSMREGFRTWSTHLY